MSLPSRIDLPPLFRFARLRGADSAFATAIVGAAEAGAGAFLLSSAPHRFDAAVVLEPSLPLIRARQAVYAGLNALGDALASLGPPQKPILYRWPDTLELDGAIAGGARLAWTPGTGETDLAAWMVVGVTLLTTWPEAAADPGLHPDLTALDQEGFDEEGRDPARLAEAFARYFLAAIGDWQEYGDADLTERYLARLASPEAAHRSFDRAGDLVLQGADGAILRMGLGARLDRRPAWLAAFERVVG